MSYNRSNTNLELKNGGLRVDNTMKETRTLPYNSNEENIAHVRADLERKLNEEGGDNRVFTMIQRNSPSKVTITAGSRKACARILTDLLH